MLTVVWRGTALGVLAGQWADGDRWEYRYAPRPPAGQPTEARRIQGTIRGDGRAQVLELAERTSREDIVALRRLPSFVPYAAFTVVARAYRGARVVAPVPRETKAPRPDRWPRRKV